MKRDKFQEVKDAASGYNAAIYLAVSGDNNIHNPRRKSVWAALENIYPLTKLQTCDWREELRKETMDNLLTVYPDVRQVVMKETIHGLFDSFEKSYWISDLTKIEGMETLDVSLYSYGIKIMDCLIPDHYSVDDWRISEMNEDIREYLECIGILAEDMMGVLQDIVGKGSFEAKDSITGLSLFEENSQTTPTEGQKTPSTGEEQGKPNDVEIPTQLTTEKAKGYFAKAIELELMNENYKWNKGKTLCACFAFGMNIELNLGKGKRKSWKPFEILFGYSNLRGNINDIKFHSQDPSEIDLVNKVFPDINLYQKIMEFE